MIERHQELRCLRGLLERHPVVGLVGARQVGKSTLARALRATWAGPSVHFDLENPEDLVRLADPMLALKGLEGLIVLDEIQRLPDVFQTLRVLVDRNGSPSRFLVLGSASPDLLRQSAETLAGRIAYRQLGGFSLDEVGVPALPTLWLRGGFPRSFCTGTDRESHEWRSAFVQTFLERDLPQLGVGVGATTMRRFWVMLAHWHGQIWRATEFARSFGVADTTVRGYLDRLTAALVVRQLKPWHENIAKRQVRSPRVYISDSGLLHALLNLRTMEDVEAHPKVGASWEGFVLEQLVHQLGAESTECFFWATHAGAELDLLVVRGRRRIGFEVKRTVAPRVTPSMRAAAQDLKLDQLLVLHAGEHSFPLAPGIDAVSVSRLLADIEPLQ
jgi:hypothetical protein